MDLSSLPDGTNLTRLLTEWHSGEPAALERLTPLIYEELRRLAHTYMRGERRGHTLQATAVVHEAYLRLIRANVAVQDRTHFFALAARLMRHVLVDHARARSRVRRSPDPTLPAAANDSVPLADFDILALDEALDGLAQMEPRLAKVIELFYFGGLKYEQIASQLDVSPATVNRDIRLARAWLLNEIAGPWPPRTEPLKRC
jgi:RNA polymerase sigma factor (TIGR02999 family)